MFNRYDSWCFHSFIFYLLDGHFIRFIYSSDFSQTIFYSRYWDPFSSIINFSVCSAYSTVLLQTQLLTLILCCFYFSSGFPYMSEIFPIPDRVFTLPMVWTEKLTANKSLPECSVHFNDAQAAKSSLDARALMKTSGISRLSFAEVTTGKGVMAALALADSKNTLEKKKLNTSLPSSTSSKTGQRQQMEIAATTTSMHQLTHIRSDIFRPSVDKNSSIQTVAYRPHEGQFNNTLV